MEDKKIASQFIQDAMKVDEYEVISQPDWIKHLASLMVREDWVRIFDYPVEELLEEINSRKPDCHACQSPLVSIDICARCIWSVSYYSGKTDRFVNDGKAKGIKYETTR